MWHSTLLGSLLLAIVYVKGDLVPKALPFQWSGRIVNGSDASIESFPFQVSMNHFGSHRCGGSILYPQLIVTAAHCVRGSIRRFTTVRAGSSLHFSGGIVVQVTHSIEHEDYNIPYTFNNDIALMFLASPLTYGSKIRPIRLPESFGETRTGSVATISGWGALEFGGNTLPDLLQYARVPIIEPVLCFNAYRSLTVITDVMMCAGLLETGGVDSCQGDSGGPLVIDGVLHGVVSSGNGCAWPGYPGIYARTSHFVDWIESNRY